MFETANMLRRKVYKKLGIFPINIEGHIYILAFASGKIKVGRSIQPTIRAKQIAKLNLGDKIVDAWVSPLHYLYGRSEFLLLKQCAGICKTQNSEYFTGVPFANAVVLAEQMTFKRSKDTLIFEEYLRTYDEDLV